MLRISDVRHPVTGCRRRPESRRVARPAILGLRSVLCAILAALPALAADDRREAAHFVVSSEVVTPDLRPFTATVKNFGNGALLNRRPGGFEPQVYRTMFLADGGTEDRVLAPRKRLSQFGMLRTGALDGAEVDVLRIENGAFRLVRQDRIADGGFQLGDWVPLFQNKAVPADNPRYDFSWARWNRSDVPYYFTVRAIDRKGNLSPPGEAISAIKPATDAKKKGKNKRSDAKLIQIKFSGQPAPDLATPRDLQIRVTQDGVAQLRWEPVPGAAGYVVYRSDDPPEALGGTFVRLEGAGPAVQAGDLVILRHKFWQADRERFLSKRVWDAALGKGYFGVRLVPGWPDEARNTWQRVPYGPDSTPEAVPGGGEGFLRVDLGQEEELVLGSFTHAGLEQTWYPVLAPDRDYRFEAWIRGDASAKVRFEFQGEHSPRGPASVAPLSARPGPKWSRFTGVFRVPRAAQSRKPGRTRLVLTGPGRIDVDNFRIYPDQAPYLGLLPENAERLKTSGMGALRLQAFGITGQKTYDLTQLTNPAGASNLHGGVTLSQQLELTQQVDMTPWITVEPHFSRAEWLGLAEFLAAPFDPERDDSVALPWAAKRAAQGQAAPWTEEFDRIQFEIGNETWNRIFQPWTFTAMEDAATGTLYSNGAVYGLYQEYVLGILRESPHWPALEAGLETVLGGWNARPYGIDAARHSPSSDVLAIASYNGGWDENEGPVRPTLQGFSSVMSNVLQTSRPRAHRLTDAVAALPSRPRELRLGTYEAGPGYALNGLNKTKVTPEQARDQELVMKSAAAGAATLDVFLTLAKAGFDVQNYYAYRSGGYWASHARWPQGGQSYPSWDLLALFQREALGNMLAIETLSVPVKDIPKYKRREAIKDAPLVAAYATHSRTETGDRLSLVLISRRIPGYPDPQDDGRTRVTIDLPITRAGRLTAWQLSGRYNSTNTDGPEAVLERQDLPVPDSLPRLEVPDLAPGMALVLVFDDIED